MFKTYPNIIAICIALLIAAAGIFSTLTNPLNHDVSWLLYVASEVGGGKTLYVDYILVNAPLSVWTNIPAHILSEWTGLNIGKCFKILVSIFAGISVFLSFSILTKGDHENLLFWLIGICLGLFILPSWNFGQREHLSAIFSLPYIFVVAKRANGIPLSIGLVLPAAVMAIIAFNIKPYFLIIPVLLELYLLSVIGFKRLINRVEPYIFGLGSLVYLLAVLIFTPDYFSKEILTYGSAVYGPAFQVPPLELLAKTFPLIVLMITALLLLSGFKQKEANARWTVFVAGLGYLLCALIQFKGFQYHLLPAQICIIIVILGSLHHLSFKKVADHILRLSTALIALLLIGVQTVFAFNDFDAVDRIGKKRPLIVKELTDFPNANSLFIFTPDLKYGFPAVTELDLDWGSRFPGSWMTVGIHSKRNELGGTSELLDEIEIFVWEKIADDLDRRQPDLVLIEKPNSNLLLPQDYDYIEDFSQNTKFRQTWKNYIKVKDTEFFYIYQRKQTN